jgi:glycerophosphoryl diester phosphodiesterase
VDKGMIEQIAETDNSALHCDYRALTPELIQHAHAHQVPLLTYTVNDPHQQQQLITQGVFGIFTDCAPR